MGLGGNGGYHQVPRDSVDSERDSTEFLIPSPQSGIIDDPSRPSEKWSLSINACSVLRVFSASFGITGFVISVIFEPSSFIPVDVFLMCSVVMNIFMLFFRGLSCPVAVSLDYEGRDLLKPGKGKGKKGRSCKPRLSSCIDLTLSIALFIPLTIALVESRHTYYWRHNPIAAGIFGYLVFVTQLIIAIPAVSSVSLVLRRVDNGKRKADKKILVVAAATSGNAVEQTAIPVDLV